MLFQISANLFSGDLLKHMLHGLFTQIDPFHNNRGTLFLFADLIGHFFTSNHRKYFPKEKITGLAPSAFSCDSSNHCYFFQ